MAFAAKQLPGGQAKRPCHGVDQGHLDRAFGKGIAFAGCIHARQNRAEAATVLSQQRGRQITVDRMADALRRFFIPGRPADGRCLAETTGAASQMQLHDHWALTADRAERQLVWANRGNVQDAYFNAFDQMGCCHGGGEIRRSCNENDEV